jgi:hypothetical protein
MNIRVLVAILVSLVAFFFSDAGFAQNANADWSKAERLDFTAVTRDPDAFTGKTFAVNATICGVRILKDGKRGKAVQYGARMAYSGMPLVTGSLPLVLDDWYATRSKSPEGRAQIRNLVKLDENTCSPLFAGQGMSLLVSVGQFSDTFEPYLSLIDLRDARSTSRASLPSSTVAPAPKTMPVEKPASKRTALLKAESDVQFSKYFRTYTLSARAKREDTFAAMAIALESLKEKAELSDAAKGVIITKPKKRFLLGLQRQMVTLIEAGDSGKSLISMKIIHSESGGVGGWQPVADEAYIERNDKQILESVAQALTNAGVPLETGRWQTE